MLEVYVVLAVGALGYLLNNLNNSVKSSKLQVNKNEIPNNKNVYDSSYSRDALSTERHIAEKAYKQALQPRKTNRVMTMAGEMVDKDAFTHNNMEPYFGGRIKQNMDGDRNQVLLENFTGVSDIQKNKCEVKSFYDQNKNIGNVFGMANNTDFYKERIVQSTMRNNEVPIAQIHVGPGLNKGYSSTGVGGYQQFEADEIARASERTVDELRVANKPKESFAGRKVSGLKTGLRGDTGKVNKNQVERFYEQTPDMYLKTTGANLKPMNIPKFDMKAQNRLDTTKEYTGTAKGKLNRTLDAGVKKTSRQQMGTTGIRNALLSAFGIGEKDDHGKGNIIVYNNERDLTSTRTYQGNVTSLIKAIIAPIEDLIKVTKKQEAVNNPREFGQLGIQMPQKPTMYDPNDLMRTTLKEQLVQDADLLNLKGAEKGTINDPDDLARTTLKEQLVQDADLLNLKGAEKGTINDPDDLARTTLKEQLIHDTEMGNLRGAQKQTIYDATDVARTTIKETILEDLYGMGAIKGATELYIYDPEEVARTTGRDTLDDVDYHANVAGHYKGTLQQEDDVRTTMKQTTIINNYTSQVNPLQDGGGYLVAPDDIKAVQRAALANHEYGGNATRAGGKAYIVTEYDAKNVQRADLANNDYYGGADSAAYKKNASHEEYDNAQILGRRELIEEGRDPTNTGVKSFNADVNMRVVKRPCDEDAERKQQNLERVYQQYKPILDESITHNKLALDLDSKIGFDRINPDILSVLKNNPYAQPLDSYQYT